MKKFLLFLFLVLLLIPTFCFAKEATFVGRSEYIIAVGTGADAEAIALEDAKRLALEQAGTYLESLTVVENNAVTLDRIKVIARGTAKLVPGSIRKQYTTIDSNTGAQKLILEAQFAIDPDEVTAELNRARSGPDLGAAQEKYDAVIAEDQRLQAELLQTSDETERASLIEKYQKSRNRFYSMQWFLRGIDEDRNNHTNKALQCFNRGIEIDPYTGENYLMKGAILGSQGDLDSALSYIEKAISLLPPDQTSDLAFAYDLKNIALKYRKR